MEKVKNIASFCFYAGIFTGFAENVKNKFNEIKNGVSEWAGNVKGKVKECWDNVSSKVKEKVDNATEIHKAFPGYEVIYGVFSKSGFTQRMLDIAKENSEILLVNEDRLV